MVYVFILLCNVIRTEKKRQMDYEFKSEHTNCVKTGINFALSPKSHTEYFSVACYVNEQHVLSRAFSIN